MTIAEQLKRAKADLDAVYAAGKASGGGGATDSFYDQFWDACQQNGERTIYQYLFVGEGWTNDNFKPKYDIVPSRANYMFQYAGIKDLTDLKRPDGTPVRLDFSQVTGNYITRPFGSSQIEKVGTIDISHITATINTFFADATALQTIGTLVVSEVNAFGTNAFQNCSALTNITIDGVLNSALNLSACPLTTKSVQSIIDHLKDLTGTTTKTLTLSSKASITDAQKNAITTKNWTLAY